MENQPIKKLISLPLIVAAMGYFVDIYDLLLFSIVRIPSLRALGVAESSLMNEGIYLINAQMAGLLVGGIFWGVLGDKKGRLSVLFGSILMYSAANIANGFVVNIDQYLILRFVAGIGLAGELGAGITLIAEILPKKLRGYGTSIVASVGLLGAVLAYFVAHSFDWRITYFIGGGLGISLLILRFNVFESGMFIKNANDKKTDRGNFFILFTSRIRFLKYLRCIVIGLPIWFVIGILITFSPELAKAAGITEPVEAGKAVMFNYIGLSLGDLGSGILSQYLKSRKKAVLLFIVLTSIGILIYLWVIPATALGLYLVCLFLGFSIGYWALFVTIAAEQFGTNLRATVATTVPDFVRGSINIMTPMFLFFKQYCGIVNSAAIIGCCTILIALAGLWKMEETYDKDLDYTEQI